MTHICCYQDLKKLKSTVNNADDRPLQVIGWLNVTSTFNWLKPKNLKQVPGFPGLDDWYRYFIENFSNEVFPITKLLSNKKTFIWTNEAQTAFEIITTFN